MKSAYVLACLMLLPSLSRGQDDIIKNFDAAAMDRFIREDLKKDFAKTEDQQTGSVFYDIKDTPYYATFNARQKFVLFFVRAQAGNLTLEKINDWNRDAIFSRAYLQNKFVNLEVPLSIGTGVTRAMLKHYYDQFEVDWKKFKVILTP